MVSNILKNLVKKFFTRMGFSISKIDINDIELYLKFYGKDDVKNKRFYNIGAGLFQHPAWTNIDYYSDHYKDNPIDINYDLLEKNHYPYLIIQQILYIQVIQ